MHVTFSPCKLIVACLFIASLFFPSFANAEQQQEELAPGFNACIKRTEANADSDDFQKRDTYLQCYRDAGDYWKNIFETEYKKETGNRDTYSGDFDGDGVWGGRYELQMIRLAWEQYFEALGDILCHEAADQDPQYLIFRAEEYKKIVQALRGYGVFKRPEKTAPAGQTKSFTN